MDLMILSLFSWLHFSAHSRHNMAFFFLCSMSLSQFLQLLVLLSRVFIIVFTAGAIMPSKTFVAFITYFAISSPGPVYCAAPFTKPHICPSVYIHLILPLRVSFLSLFGQTIFQQFSSSLQPMPLHTLLQCKNSVGLPSSKHSIVSWSFTLVFIILLTCLLSLPLIDF